MPTLKSHAPSEPIKEMADAITKTMKDCCDKYPEIAGIEILAVVSQIVGRLIAFQDQREYTREMLMHLIAQNIQEGNNQAIQSLTSPEGSA